MIAPVLTVTCGRCHAPLPRADAECCWHCPAYLCGECWELLGHCGHPEAERLNELARQRGVSK